VKLRIILAAIVILALVGVADSAYALKQHYAPPESSSCDVNETISCTAVNQSEYSVLLGVPVAGIGIAGYLLQAGLATVALISNVSYRLIGRSMLILAAGALAFSSWLTWVEIFVLKAVCPLCVLSLSVIAAISVLALLVTLTASRQGKDVKHGV
jgi:uncharacterized membrane protein